MSGSTDKGLYNDYASGYENHPFPDHVDYGEYDHECESSAESLSLAAKIRACGGRATLPDSQDNCMSSMECRQISSPARSSNLSCQQRLPEDTSEDRFKTD